MDATALKNAFKILKVEEHASLDQVKRAYRAQAKIKHPDRNPSPTAHEEFVELTEAYELIQNALNPATTPVIDHDLARKEARKRAEDYAKMRYEQFIKSDYYKDTVAVEVVGKVIVLLLFTSIMILIPVMTLLFEGVRAFFSSLILVLIISPILVIYRKEFTLNGVQVAFNRLFKLKATWYFLILIFNGFVFFKIGLSTLISIPTLLLLFFVVPLMIYLIDRVILMIGKRLFNMFILGSFTVSLILMINFIFSEIIRTEQHYYIKPVSSTLLVFEGNGYDKYPGVRIFYKMDNIKENDGLEFTLEKGFFGINVVKNFEFISKR
ncbi:MAG: J domain-containing protein [Chitinophagales bacterium]|nr:J domain-containing protein [Chitinophagales bacterium]